MVEDASADAVEVFGGALAVGEVVALVRVILYEGAGGAARDGGNLPARHHAPAGAVPRAHVVVVGQLHLAVVEVVVAVVLVGDVECKARGGDCGAGGCGILRAAAVVGRGVVAAYDLAAVDGRDVGTAGDVAVEHAVHHHRLEVVVGCADVGGGGRCHVVVTHQAADVGAAGDVGVGVAVDHADRAVEQAHQAAGVARAGERAAEDAHVVYARRAVGGGGHGAGVAAMAADGHVREHQVPHRTGEGGEEGRGEAADAVGHLRRGVDGRLEGAAEGGDTGCAAADVGRDDIVTCCVGDAFKRCDGGLCRNSERSDQKRQ